MRKYRIDSNGVPSFSGHPDDWSDDEWRFYHDARLNGVAVAHIRAWGRKFRAALRRFFGA